ncbi:alcohol dehydrogenase catalytic domain-containing protein [Paenibacillus mendelii]|uniref:Alcohol dehydrogenase catalytic domain-containing protein n=1 Tax=Paenibacillus mendelii TaxID=206163 RepID=A0ABV6J1Y8_9BACL|nr:alcohol dehydrogenase catalytic domain-containing protein [Paenibacillus mendelii]MCQ6562814.1 alcohol dehydrogenase catalytic domain-containing protein [Paenibacillus mendelii]
MRRIAVRDGVPVIEDFEPAKLGEMEVRIRTEYSAISPGTELMLLRNKAAHVPLGYSGVGIVEEVGSAVEHLRPGQRAAVYGVPT